MFLNFIQSEPYWRADELCEIEDADYQFEKQNCFTKAIVAEGAVISFAHPAYKSDILKITVKKDKIGHECELDNVTNIAWWNKRPQVKTWYINKKYHIEVRAKEFDYHPPHFHVVCAEYEAVYRLSDGKLYKCGNKKLPPVLAKEIEGLYVTKKEELIEAWELLHGKM